MPKSPPIGTTQMQILAILDKGPSFAAAMLEEHPELVPLKDSKEKDVMVVDSGAIYTKLKRLANRGLIERIHKYRIPNADQYTRKTRSRAVWYRLTATGRDVLQEHRKAIKK